MDSRTQAARSAQVAAVFDRAAATYDNVGVPWFTPIARELVRLAAPAPGERVLDAGCGRGAALIPLAEAVGDHGRATGIDLSPAMLHQCRAEVDRRGLPAVDLHLMDASAPALPPESFDLIVSSLVVFFLPDPLAALTTWRRLLVPAGGRVALSTFAGRDPAWDSVDAVFRAYLPPAMLDARTTGAAGPFASDAGVEELLAAAGFSGARTESSAVEIVFTDEAEWHTFTWSHGQRAMWEAIEPGRRPHVRAEAAERLEDARGADGLIRFRQQVRYTLAGT